MKILFATNNLHKINEVREALTGRMKETYELTGLQEMGIFEELPETKDTLEGNAFQKASYVYGKYAFDCFADDTGLEVTALNNRPGVYSARYAGPNCNFEDNVNKLLYELNGIQYREARFRTVIALILKGKSFFFEGSISGTISTKQSGKNGFGYDPVFIPSGFLETFAEMSLDAKNTISHRAKAVEKLVRFLSDPLLLENIHS
jgi:XTP/dITP diphosphohydrolase